MVAGPSQSSHASNATASPAWDYAIRFPQDLTQPRQHESRFLPRARGQQQVHSPRNSTAESECRCPVSKASCWLSVCLARLQCCYFRFVGSAKIPTILGSPLVEEMGPRCFATSLSSKPAVRAEAWLRLVWLMDKENAPEPRSPGACGVQPGRLVSQQPPPPVLGSRQAGSRSEVNRCVGRL